MLFVVVTLPGKNIDKVFEEVRPSLVILGGGMGGGGGGGTVVGGGD